MRLTKNEYNKLAAAIRRCCRIQPAAAFSIGLAVGLSSAPALAGPEGGVVTAGSGTITQNDATTTVGQASNFLRIDWQSFNVAAHESVLFQQPNSSAVALNRIHDQSASRIFGTVQANGHLFLINSNGILFGRTAQVNVGSLVASSLDVLDYDAATGHFSLGGKGGAIVNDGTLVAGRGGSVSLIGGSVANNGLIVADYGVVNLAAGATATLDFHGDGLMRFEVDGALASGSGTAVSNAGAIQANGGQVFLTAEAAHGVFDRAINNEGVIRANRIENVGGTIRLLGPEGTVINSGTLDASGVGMDSTGGSVSVLGNHVGLFGNARVDVSGDAGGGTALIGGDYQGSNADVLNASRTFVSSGSQINASARVDGDGGKVVVWADELTRFQGLIAARELIFKEKVAAFFGGLDTPVSLAIVPLVNKEKVPFVGIWAAGTNITHNGAKPNYVFRVSAVDALVDVRLLKHAEKLGGKKAGLILINNPWGESNQKGLIAALQAFDQIYVMTQGGPYHATDTVVTEIYQTGFQKLDLGVASALSYVLLIGTLVLSLLQFLLGSRREKDLGA